MPHLGLLVGTTRLRLALVIAGLAWLFGLVPPPGQRITVMGLVLVGLLIEWLLDPPPLREPAPPRDRHHTPA